MKIKVLQFKRYMPLKESWAAIQRTLNTGKDTWITLGSFDTLQIYNAEDTGTSLFNQIEKEQEKLLYEEIDACARVRNLYLLMESTEEEQKQECAFLAVVRIHFLQHSSYLETIQAFRQNLENAQTEGLEQVESYRSADLSDLVILCKADDLKKIADFALQVRQFGQVGKAYTYFCINSQCLKDNWEGKPSESLDYASMWFSAKPSENLSNAAQQVIDILKTEHLISVSGHNDLLATMTDFNPQNLIDLYRSWFSNDGISSEDWPFSDVTTMVGSIFQLNSWQCQKGDNIELQKCHELILIRNEIMHYHKRENNHLPEWFWQMSNLLNALVNISSSVITDEFFFLLYPGVHTFMRAMIPSEQQIDKRMISTFLHDWGLLNEMIIQNEGQITTRPEMYPHIHSLSFMLSEYIIAFLYLSQELLRDNDSDTHDILLLPTDIPCIETEEICRKTERNNGLITIRVPALQLGDIGDVLGSLCHEISHFVGESTRNRDTRIKCYALSVCAFLATSLLHNPDDKLIHVLANDKSGTIQGLEQFLKEETRDEVSTQEKLSNDAVEWIVSYFQEPTPKNQTQIISCLLKNWKEGSPYIEQRYEISEVMNIKYTAMNIGNLYREVYADLCTIKILNLNSESYIRILAEDIRRIRYETDRDKKSNAIIILAARIFICNQICTMDHYKLGNIQHKGLLDAIKRIEKTILLDEANDEFPASVLQPLIDYARSCSECLDQRMKQRPKVLENIREAYRAITVPASQTQSEQIEKVIDYYRNCLLA